MTNPVGNFTPRRESPSFATRPTRRGITSQYLPAVALMRADPGTWYLIREYAPTDPGGHLWTPSTARNLADRIRTGRPQCFAPKGSFESVAESTPDGVHKVYARYLPAG